ncbi:MAG: DUF2752 domain-containing protein [Planctomycetes bacterium]|nr:DUF2752 domain-containing protein [Planctomycetota bacterium]
MSDASADDSAALDESAPARDSSHYVILALLWAGVAGMVALHFFASPAAAGYGTHEQLGLPPCRLMQWTGVPCPGCGVTTSVTHVVHGEPLEALRVQPFGLVTTVLWPLAALWGLAVHLRGGDLYAAFGRLKKPWLRVLLGVMAACWVYKLAVVLG